MQCPRCSLTHNRKNGKNMVYAHFVVDSSKDIIGILAWVLGDSSSETIKLLWQIISCLHSYF